MPVWLKTCQKKLGSALATAIILILLWLFEAAGIPSAIGTRSARIILSCLSIGTGFWLFAAWCFARKRRKKMDAESKSSVTDAESKPSVFDEYAFDSRAGIRRHKTKPGVFCPGCFLKSVISQMKEIKHGWFCPGCEKRYPDPDNPPPKRERLSIRPFKGWWD